MLRYGKPIVGLMGDPQSPALAALQHSHGNCSTKLRLPLIAGTDRSVAIEICFSKENAA
jgi:hypothetical protein